MKEIAEAKIGKTVTKAVVTYVVSQCLSRLIPKY
jgi:hypothetical protein